MTVIKSTNQWSVEDCIEDCHYASRYCEEQDDGTLRCPSGIRDCAEACRKHYGD